VVGVFGKFSGGLLFCSRARLPAKAFVARARSVSVEARSRILAETSEPVVFDRLFVRSRTKPTGQFPYHFAVWKSGGVASRAEAAPDAHRGAQHNRRKAARRWSLMVSA